MSTSLSAFPVDLAEDRLRDLNRELGFELVKRPAITRSTELSDRYQARILVVDEGRQTTNAYKIRGAANKIMALRTAKRGDPSGVVAASAGNHGRGVAEVCRVLEIASTIVVPRSAPQTKIDFIRNAGSQVIQHGRDYDEAFEHAQLLCRRNPELGTFIHPFADAEVIAGQGTLIREAIQSLDHGVDVILCPVGGGGLLTGTYAALFGTHRHPTIIAVEPEQANALQQSTLAGRSTRLSRVDTIADGVAVRQPGRPVFDLWTSHRFPIVTVSETSIIESIHSLYRHNIVAEGAGALSVAALDQTRASIRGKTVLCLMTGANIDAHRLAQVFRRAELLTGKRLDLILDLPSGDRLESIAHICAAHGANIARLNLDEDANPRLDGVLRDVSLGLRLTDAESRQALISAFRARGFGVREGASRCHLEWEKSKFELDNQAYPPLMSPPS